jgi:hypothetical protein
VAKGEYERHLREGSDVSLLGHSTYEAWHAFHNLLPSKNARELFREIAKTRSLQDLKAKLNQIDIKQDEAAVLLHLPPFKRYMTRLANGVASERITAISSKQRNPMGSKSRQPGSTQKKSKTNIRTVEIESLAAKWKCTAVLRPWTQRRFVVSSMQIPIRTKYECTTKSGSQLRLSQTLMQLRMLRDFARLRAQCTSRSN